MLIKSVLENLSTASNQIDSSVQVQDRKSLVKEVKESIKARMELKTEAKSYPNEPKMAAKFLANNDQLRMFYGEEANVSRCAVAAMATAMATVAAVAVAVAGKTKGKGKSADVVRPIQLTEQINSGLTIEDLLSVRREKI